MRRSFLQVAFGMVAMISCADVVRAAGPDWTTLAGSNDRAGQTDSAHAALGAPAWVLCEDQDGIELRFWPLSGIVGADGFGYAFAERLGDSVLVKFDLALGAVLWTREVPEPFLDSWATPTLDLEHGSVLLASDLDLLAMDTKDGSELWRTELAGDAVNSTVAITEDLGDRDRAFVTDFDLAGRDARLYCVNIDAFDPALNPFEPGEVVWSTELGGFGGTTPAYHDGRIYIATSADGGFGAGRILAFDATSDALASPLWTFTNVRATDFFGGVTVRAHDGRLSVYGASFAFDGQTASANLVKIDAVDGSLVWSTPSNRTDSIPIVLEDGRIVLSTGISGFGSKPMIQVFEDLGDRAELLWDSVNATWQDADADGVCDPGEYLVVGGWTHQPVVALSNNSTVMYVGAISTDGGDFDAYTDLHAIDLGLLQGPEAFVEHFIGTGGSPTIAGGYLLSVGADGLHAFAVSALAYDVNGDGFIDIEDLYAWEQGKGVRDVDGDGTVNQVDRALLIRELRREDL